jgi:beta-glucuronidase
MNTSSRVVLDLSGTWQFMLDDEQQVVDVTQPLPTDQVMAVPAAFNDQTVDKKLREHSGFVWYEKAFTIADVLQQQRLVLRFGSATHEAWVYINGQAVGHHKGGFTPFEFEINSYLQAGTNRLTVRLSNLLDYTTLPVGHYTETKDAQGHLKRHVDENFDFFNYAGLQRPVKIYATPKDYIQDISVTPDIDLTAKTAAVQVAVAMAGALDDVKVTIFDEAHQVVGQGQGQDAVINLTDIHLWQPLQAYLYTAKVEGLKAGKAVDVYTEPFGLRQIDVTKGQFLINGEPFYFKGFGKHEDTPVNGRGLNEAYNNLDVNLMKDMGANSFRTSHYPYSEEMMRLCDREGIVVIDEVPAVGLFDSFGFNLELDKSDYQDSTWDKMQTAAAHRQAITELIHRDKNHACVVMWSIANEAATFTKGAHEYFQPLFELARQLDPQKRPCTYTCIMMATPESDKCIDLVDVIALNRYYGWYLQTGDLDTAAQVTRQELLAWQAKYPDKPIMYTEYGADTVAGLHSAYGEPFSEEYQEDYYRMNSAIFDEIKNFVGEQLWNFADFQTKFGINRVMGNRKGIFTRSRQPKMVVRYLKDRWTKIPNLGYKK